jgi:putative flippase GtrA
MIRRELQVFLMVGVLTVLTDFIVYRSVVWTGVDIHVAKAVGFMSGTVFAYFANLLWTFRHTRPAQGSIWRFLLLYSLTLVTNVHVNALVLAVLGGQVVGAMQLAFLAATGTSASLNFLGMKFFVFKSAHCMEST